MNKCKTKVWTSSRSPHQSTTEPSPHQARKMRSTSRPTQPERPQSPTPRVAQPDTIAASAALQAEMRCAAVPCGRAPEPIESAPGLLDQTARSS